MGATVIARPWRYVDRGSITAYDKTTADFTTDGTWRDIDLSAIVPAAAKMIAFKLRIEEDNIDRLAEFRTKGHADAADINTICERPAVANNTFYFWGCLSAGAYPQILQYRFTNTVWTAIDFVVMGWWL